MTRTRPLLAVAAVAAVCAAAVVPSFAADPEGPPFGNGTATAEIVTLDGEPDADDYVSPLLVGDVLDVTVTAKGRSPLLPSIRLLDPSGDDRTPALTSKKEGRSVSFRDFVADESGRWTVRIEGGSGTEGAYVATFSVKPAPRLRVKKGVLGGVLPNDAAHSFESATGSLVTLRLVPTKKGADVRVLQFRDPRGIPIPAMLGATKVRKGVTTLTRFEMPTGPGAHEVTVGTEDEEATYRLEISVSPQPRAKGKAKFKKPEPRIAAAASPQRIASGITARIDGEGFSVDPPVRFLFDGAEGTVTLVSSDGTFAEVIPPVHFAPDTADLVAINGDGQAHARTSRAYFVARPQINEVWDTLGRPVRKAPSGGGDTLDIRGANFDDRTTVKFGDVPAEVAAVLSPAALRIVSPAVPPSTVEISVADEFGRTSTAAFQFLIPLRGWGEGDVGRFPAPSESDDLGASRAAIGDLDRDGRADDVVLVSRIRSFANGGASHGARVSETRVLAEGPSRAFADVTDARFPAPLLDDTPWQTDDWNADALVLGDLDGDPGPEVVIAGFADTYADGFGEGLLFGSHRFASGVRAFRNDGKGSFHIEEADQGLPQARRPDLDARDENDVVRPLLGRFGPDLTDASALALGDLDRDGDADLVLIRREHGLRRVRQDVRNVDFSAEPPTILSEDADAFTPPAGAEYAYVSGTDVIDNRLSDGGAMTYVTEHRMPLSFGGYSASYQGTGSPAFHGDDGALADLDGDGDLDLVVTWHDPTSVSVRGLRSRLQSAFDGTDPPLSLDGPRVATRVLLNDGGGRFTDATDAWMPAGGGSGGAEWWHAHRLALADIDADGDADLVLAHRDGLEAWRPGALADVTSSAAAGTSTPGTIDAAESEVHEFTVATAGVHVVEVVPGTLPDSVLRLYGPDSTTTLVATDDDGGVGRGSRIVRHLTAGVWTAKVSAFTVAQTGTYSLSVRGRTDPPPAASRTLSALRVLRNDRGDGRFVDVTASALPPLPAGDDFRGGALRVADVDADGAPDVLVATTEALTGTGGVRLSSLRLLRGGPGTVFTLDASLLPPPSRDSGEAEDIQLLPSPEGLTQPSILLVTGRTPAASQGGRRTRLLDWNR